jgi:hypothetical protein
MAKATKITKSELEELQINIRHVNDLQMQIGTLEMQKATMISKSMMLQQALAKFQDTLKEKYGDVIVNINNGNLKPRKDGEVNKKD